MLTDGRIIAGASLDGGAAGPVVDADVASGAVKFRCVTSGWVSDCGHG